MPVYYRGSGGSGGTTALSGLTTDTTVSAVTVAQALRYANGRWRNATPQKLNLWDFILDQLAGVAYVPTYRIYGCSITSGQPTLTVLEDQFTAAMAGQSILVDQAGAAGAVLSTTILTYNNAKSVTLATNASATVTTKGVSRITGTNVSVAVDAWLAALAVKAALTPGGAMGEVPPGHFLVDGNHVIGNDVWIEGAGQWRSGFVLKASASANTDVFRTTGFTGYTGQTAATNANAGCHGFKVEGLFIDGNFRSNSSARNGLAIYGFDYYLKDLMVTGCKLRAIWSELSQVTSGSPHQTGTGPGGLHAYWDRVMVQNSADSSDQVYFQGPHDSFIRGLDVYKDGSFATNGIYTLAGGSQWSDVHVWGNHTIGVNIAAGGQLFDNLQSEGNDLQLRIAGTKIKVDHARLYGVVGSSADEGMELTGQAGDGMFTNIKFEDFDVCALRYSGGGGDNCITSGGASTTTATPPPIVLGTPHVLSTHDIINMGGYQADAFQNYRERRMGPNLVQYEDHFMSGSAATTGIGAMGWVVAAANTNLASEADHPGIVRIATSAASGTVNYLADKSTSANGPVLAAEERVHLVWVVRTNSNDIDTRVRIGLITDQSAASPTDGIYFEKLDADTNWFAVTRAASVQTGSRTDTTVAVTNTGWKTFEIRKVASSWLFSIDGTLVRTETANVPSAAMHMAVQIRNNAAADKTFDADYASLYMAST